MPPSTRPRPSAPRGTRRALTRGLVGASLSALASPRPSRAQAHAATPTFSYPMGLAGRPLGDGLLIRHGYACENTWFFPGHWHTGEDWYAAAGESAGLGVFAVADGQVVFAGSEYPGLVVIVQHAADLYSMYGHLDDALSIEQGQQVTRGQLLGTVLARADGLAPSHLHFEMRTFLTTTEVNGDAPRYSFNCGFNCAPGPGYWPIDAPEHPSAMGWRNPAHVINRRAWGDSVPEGATAIVAGSAPASAPLWSAPAGAADAAPIADLVLTPGERYPLLAISAGAEDTTGTSAEAYTVWYRIAPPDGEPGWARAAVPAAADTGADGRPSSVQFVLLPDIGAA